MLTLHDITVRRGGRTLLDRVSLSIEPRCVTGILGPNGAGKSTLLKVAAGDWRPDSGEVALDGTTIQSLGPLALAERRAVVPQSTHLAFPFSVLEVVRLGSSVPGFGLRNDPEPALAAIRDVGLQGFENRDYTRLSGGEKQRVHIARAICQLTGAFRREASAKVLLLDEPTASLDPAHQALVMSLLVGLAARGTAVAIVLHDLNLAAAWVDRLVLMSAGRIVAEGSPAAALSDALLTETYGCPMRVGVTPANGGIFVLPHHARDQAPPRVSSGRGTASHR